MRIVTLNTWKCDGAYGRRLDLMIDGLGELQPDIVLLQEVFASDDGLHDTALRISNALSMACVRAPSRAKNRMVDGRSIPSTSGLATLSRHPATQAHILPLPADREDGERIAHVARLSLEGHSIWVANLHLSHLPDAAALRRDQLTVVLKSVVAMAHADLFVVGGDFNASLESKELSPFLRSPWELNNPFHGQVKYTHCADDGRVMDIDHILTGNCGSWRVTNASTAMNISDCDTSMPPSDHAAVVVDLVPR